MRYILADVEANGLDPDRIHCISLCEGLKGSVMRFTEPELSQFIDFVESGPTPRWFFHNGLNYDVHVINKLVKKDLIDPQNVVDTQVVSRLVDYKKFNTHSLKELGQHLGVHKGDYTGGWEVYTEEMGVYCDQDVEVLKAIVKMYWPQITDPSMSKAMRLEHDVALMCREMSVNGFLFDVNKAEELLASINKEKEELEASFKTAFGKTKKADKTVQFRVKDNGELYANVKKDFGAYPPDMIEMSDDGTEYTCYSEHEFNAGSPRERIDALWEAGWKPVNKTKGHINAERNS